MNFITTTNAALKWGITPNRITILCNGGRIPGAQKIGNSWMIPDNADKPGDARTRKVKKNKKRKINAGLFRFPVFEGHDEMSFPVPLTKEEIQLKKAMEAYHACRFEEVGDFIGDLCYASRNKYTRMYALHIACMTEFRLLKIKEFFDYYTSLSDEFKEDFAHKDELYCLLHIIDGSIMPNNYYFTEFKIDYSYSFDETFSSKAAALCFIKLFYTVSSGKVPDDLSTYEFICKYFDDKGCYVDSQLMHYYLGIVYLILNKPKDSKYHLHIALRLAQKYELYCSIAELYYYFKQPIDQVLSEFEPEFSQNIKYFGLELHNRYNEFNTTFSHKTNLYTLPSDDYVYVFSAVQGLSAKKLAKLTKQPASFVSAKYAEIFKTLGVKSKKGLVKEFKNLFNKPNA